MPEIISRKEARALGLKYYFTGEPCKRGHVAQRYVSVCTCIECHRERYIKRGHRPRQEWLESLGDKLENRRARSRRHVEKNRQEINRRSIERVAKGRAALRALKELGIEI